MRLVRFARLGGLLASGVVLTLAASLSPGASSAAADPTGGPTATADPTPASTSYPTNAAKIFRWGNAQVKDEFIGPLTDRWLVNADGRGIVRNQHGMLTLNTPEIDGRPGRTVVAQLKNSSRPYGRWEARVRTRQYGAGTPYRAVWELIPSAGDRCARRVAISEYWLGSSWARSHLRNSPDLDFVTGRTMDLSNDTFHTYAVEITRDRISWFIDTRVVMTERRDPARTGAYYNIRFRMVKPETGRTVRSRMQMDWVRYYSLERPNAQPVTAPPSRLDHREPTC